MLLMVLVGAMLMGCSDPIPKPPPEVLTPTLRPVETPALSWTTHLPGIVASKPLIEGVMVYVVTDSCLCVLDAATGHEKWQFFMEGFTSNTPLIDGTTIYFSVN